MKKAAAALVLVALGAAPAFAQGMSWVEDYSEGLRRAAAEKKPILVFFHSPG